MGLFFYFIYLFDKNVNLLYLALSMICRAMRVKCKCGLSSRLDRLQVNYANHYTLYHSCFLGSGYSVPKCIILYLQKLFVVFICMNYLLLFFSKNYLLFFIKSVTVTVCVEYTKIRCNFMVWFNSCL